MKVFLYILLGLSLGSGLTLIALQERFIRERRRLLAMGESQLAQAAQALAEAKEKRAEELGRLTQDLAECRGRLAIADSRPPIDPEGLIDRDEHDRLLREREAEISRLATENLTLADHLARQQGESADLNGQITFLKGELGRVEAEKAARPDPDDDFLLLGQPGGHLLPGAVVRAFIKGRQDKS